MPSQKQRLDVLLVERGFFVSRERAQRAVMAGVVRVGGRVADKPGMRVGVEEVLTVKEAERYVGRGGLKLEAALRHFGVDPTGRTCLDIGASTGGFTDCLLQHGAARVYAVDVGHGQLDWKIRSDPRVIVREKFNARYMTPGDFAAPPSEPLSINGVCGSINGVDVVTNGVGVATNDVGAVTNDVGAVTNGVGAVTNGVGGVTNGVGGVTNDVGGATNGVGGATNGVGGSINGVGGSINGVGGGVNGALPAHFPSVADPISLCVVDVSFISLTLILPPAFAVLEPGGTLLALIKPQFELSKALVDPGRGVVRDAAAQQSAVDKIAQFVREVLRQRWVGVMDSPILGGDGNREFLACLQKSSLG